MKFRHNSSFTLPKQSLRSRFFFFLIVLEGKKTLSYTRRNTGVSPPIIRTSSGIFGGGRVVRWSWIHFQVRGVLLVWIRVGQGPTALAVGAGGGCLDIFTLIYPFSFLSPSLWETTRYRLKYCLKGSLSQKTTNQPTKSGIFMQLYVCPPFLQRRTTFMTSYLPQ